MKKTVYAYACGDILHYGHISFLEKAKEKGDYLIVGVLSDKAIMEKKQKPIMPLDERIKVIEALKCVDLAIVQYEYSPLENVKKFKPNVLIESNSHEHMPANAFVKDYGGKVVIIPYYKGISSSDIKNKILKLWKRKR